MSLSMPTLHFVLVVAQVYLFDLCQRIIGTSHNENLSKWLSWYNFVSSCIQVRNHETLVLRARIPCRTISRSISLLGRLVLAFMMIISIDPTRSTLVEDFVDIMDATRSVEFHKKRRRVTKASLTKLSTKLTELETNDTNADTLALKLKTLDTEFKTHQLAVIDLTDDDDSLAAEQQELDDHDDLGIIL